MIYEMKAEEVKSMLQYVAEKIILHKPYLTEVDSAVGDGDHGIGMAKGMKKVLEKLTGGKEYTNVYEIFGDAGKAMMMSMGGASGIIFGSLYLSGAMGQEPSGTMTAYDFACMEERSLAAIKERGKAQPGDKTMVDALSPAVTVMKETYTLGFGQMFREAEEAARMGMENTKNMTARFGRAKSLMERSLGYQDAGATSVYLIFQGMREYTEQLEQCGS